MPEAPFVYGELGIDACPTGYEPIRDEQTCITASQHLGDPYSANHRDGHPNALCNGFACGAENGQGSGCTGTRLSANHGGGAKWICQALGVSWASHVGADARTLSARGAGTCVYLHISA